jgi:hypothetical protein
VAVIPHFDTFGEGWVAGTLETAPRDDSVLVGIDERSAALWREGTWRAFGPGGITVFVGGSVRRFDAGEAIEGIPQPLA